LSGSFPWSSKLAAVVTSSSTAAITEARVVVLLQLKRAFLGPVQDEVLLV